MKAPYGLGIRIWITAVFINSLLFSFYGLVSDAAPSFLIGLVVAFLGVILTFPYIAPVRYFIGIASKLPFCYNAKLVWVASLLGILSSGFYWFFSIFFGLDSGMFLCMAVTATAVILSVGLHSKKILLFFRQEQEYRMQVDFSIKNQHPLQNAESVCL